MKNNYNFEAWDIDTVDPETVTVEELLFNLVGWAVLAPSSHNSQPWRFILRPENNSIEVCLLENRVLKYSDKKGRQARISIGCALCNILAAAEYYDLEVRVEYLEDDFYPLPLIKLVFNSKKGGTKEKSGRILEAIKNRRVNRGEFEPLRQIPEDLSEKIQTIVRKYSLAFNAITDVPTRLALGGIQYSADRAVIALNDFRHELAEFFLPNDTEKGIGMPGNTFGLSDDMARFMHEELKKSGPFDPDLAAGMAISGRKGIESSPLVGVISVPEDLPIWWIKAGVVFEEIALEAEIRGLSIAVHAAIVEVEMFNRLLKLRLGQKYRPTVIFRMGYAKENKPHSPRLKANQVSEVVSLMGGG